MTKSELKKLIKEVLDEAQTLTADEATWPQNVIVNQIADVIKANPIYKGISVSYMTGNTDYGSANVFANIGKAGDGYPYVMFFVDGNGKIRLKSLNDSGDRISKDLSSIDDAIKLAKNPTGLYKPSTSSPLKGATITKIIDRGDYGMEVYIKTQDGKIIKGNLSIEN